MPLFENYFGACIEYFFPRNIRHSHKSEQFDDFRRDLLENILPLYTATTQAPEFKDTLAGQQNEPVVVNDILVRDYLKLLK